MTWQSNGPALSRILVLHMCILSNYEYCVVWCASVSHEERSASCSPAGLSKRNQRNLRTTRAPDRNRCPACAHRASRKTVVPKARSDSATARRSFVALLPPTHAALTMLLAPLDTNSTQTCNFRQQWAPCKSGTKLRARRRLRLMLLLRMRQPAAPPGRAREGRCCCMHGRRRYALFSRHWCCDAMLTWQPSRCALRPLRAAPARPPRACCCGGCGYEHAAASPALLAVPPERSVRVARASTRLAAVRHRRALVAVAIAVRATWRSGLPCARERW